MKRYLVLGFTAHISSANILGRYKRVFELQDIYVLRELRRYVKGLARRRRVFVFVVDDELPEDSALYLVSYDINGRKATREYTRVKESLFTQLCARVDRSTYVCPLEPDLTIVKMYASKITIGKVWIPDEEPVRSLTIQHLKQAYSETITWLLTRLLAIKKKPRAFGTAQKKRQEFLGILEAVLGSRHLEKLAKLGITFGTLRSEMEEVKRVVSNKT